MKKNNHLTRKLTVAALALTMLSGCAAPVVDGTPPADENPFPSEPQQTAEAVGNVVHSTDEALTPQLLTVTGGEILGYYDNGVYVFKGIPYGKSERFQEAAPASWEGIRSCFSFGEVCPQYRVLTNGYHVNDAEWTTPSGSDMVGSEADCLNLNVWTSSMDSGANKPVVVFIHGGGGTAGSTGELAAYDGDNFADTTDCVFVSINKRVNFLGKLDVSAYGGEEYKNSGNNTLLDNVLGLQWVQDNIVQFGGNPGNVTLLGQSAGTYEVWSLSAMPMTENLFVRAVVASGGSSDIRSASKENQQAETAKLVEHLGLTEEDDVIGTLTSMSFEDLYTACEAAGVRPNMQHGEEIYPEPILNDEGQLNEYAAQRSYLIANNFSEFGFSGEHLVLDSRFHGPIDMNTYSPEMTEEWKTAKLSEVYGEQADAVAAAFLEAFPDHDVIDVAYFSVRYRTSILNHCLNAANSGATVYNALIAYKVPFMGGHTMWHSGDIPLWFNNIDKVGYIFKGDYDNAQRIADALSSAVAAFATNGDPSTKYLTVSPFTADNQLTMVFDTDLRQVENLDTEMLDIIGGQ